MLNRDGLAAAPVHVMTKVFRNPLIASLVGESRFMLILRYIAHLERGCKTPSPLVARSKSRFTLRRGQNPGVDATHLPNGSFYHCVRSVEACLSVIEAAVE